MRSIEDAHGTYGAPVAFVYVLDRRRIAADIAAPRAAVARLATHPFVVDVLAPLVATRIAIFAIALITFRFPLDASLDLSRQHLLSALARWDGEWYLRIASSGYEYVPGQFSSVAFAPLLPILMRALSPVFGGGTDGMLVAGVVVANVALVAALAYLVALTRLDFDGALSRRAALYLMVFPTAFFLSAVYPESLFLALAIASFYYARTRRWLVAGALAAGCALARPHGVAIVLPLAIEYAMQNGGLSRRLVRPQVLVLALPVLAFAGWVGYLGARFGDPLVFLHAQSVWERNPAAPWEAFATAFGPQRSPISDVLFTLVFMGLTVLAALWLRPSYAVYALIYVLIPLSTGQIYSMMRFGLSLFPAFIVLAKLGEHPIFDRAYVPAALMIGGAFMSFFVAAMFFLA